MLSLLNSKTKIKLIKDRNNTKNYKNEKSRNYRKK